MKYQLEDDVLSINLKEDAKKELMLFCIWHNIHNIGELLKYGKEIKENPKLNSLTNILKFDNELTNEELIMRNNARKKIKVNIDSKLLKNKLEFLSLSDNLIKQLNKHQIFIIEDLINGKNYDYLCSLKNSEINSITSALKKYNLYLNVINPINNKYELKKENKNVISWDEHYKYLQVFYYYFGHTFIPKDFTNKTMGDWIQSQRKAYNGTKGTISQDKIAKLNAVNMAWKSPLTIKNGKEIYQKLNIKNIELKDGILYTYYLDNTVKSTADKKFNEILDLHFKGEYDFNIPIETSKVNLTQLFENKIDTMSVEKNNIEESNQRKEELIERYKKLLTLRNKVIEEGHQLDDTICKIIGIDNYYIEDIPYENINDLKEKIKQKQEENIKKKKLIEKYKKLLEELKKEEEISINLDQKIRKLSSPKTYVKRK